MSLSSLERQIRKLTRQMQVAAAAEDFERAALLRGQIEALRGPTIRQPPPGQMGLGTNIPVLVPPIGWTLPKRPDPMTRNVKPRNKSR